MKSNVETNPRHCLDLRIQLPSKATLLMTAPAEDCWLYRIRLAKDVTLVAMPDFGGINVHLQTVPACHTSVPYENPDIEIMNTLRPFSAGSQSERAWLGAIAELKKKITELRCGASPPNRP